MVRRFPGSGDGALRFAQPNELLVGENVESRKSRKPANARRKPPLPISVCWSWSQIRLVRYWKRVLRWALASKFIW
jgi:hypothetical protein